MTLEIQGLPDSEASGKQPFNRQFFVLLGSLGIGTVIIGWAIIDASGMAQAASNVQDYMLLHLGSGLMIANTLFLMVAVFLIFSKWGKIRLGSDDAKPALNTVTWLFMMFSAGVGATIVFWAAAEPLIYLQYSRFDNVATEEIASRLIAAQLFGGGGLHMWACYALVGVAIGYFGFRKKQSLTFSSPLQSGFLTFMPRIPANILGVFGDCLAVTGMLFGIGASIAIGALMLASGLNEATAGKIPNNNTSNLLILLALIFSSLTASLLGLKRGLAFVSKVNILIAIAFVVYLTIFTDLQLILRRLGTMTYHYPSAIFEITYKTFSKDAEYIRWIQEWPLTYFFWTVSWSPFVGAFLAEISQGRTIRQMLLGCLLFPTVFGAVWLVVIGGWAIDLNSAENGALATAVYEDISNAIFLALDPLPWGAQAKMAATILAGIFLVTTMAAGVLVLGVLSTGKATPGKRHQIFWAAALGAVAAVVVLTKSIEVVRAAPVFAAGPLILLTLFAVLATLRFLRDEQKDEQRQVEVSDSAKSDAG